MVSVFRKALEDMQASEILGQKEMRRRICCLSDSGQYTSRIMSMAVMPSVSVCKAVCGKEMTNLLSLCESDGSTGGMTQVCLDRSQGTHPVYF